MDQYLRLLKEREYEAKVEVMAFMSYNPSIGRVLEKNGVKKFQKMAIEQEKELSIISTELAYDEFHASWVNSFRTNISTNKNRRCSYGQAQKAINVFLKLYVDWSKLPDKKTAKKLEKWLHVPLDSIVMENIKEQYPEFYNNQLTRNNRENINFSLAKIQKKEYDKWQKFFRKKHPRKPILFDVVWAINR